MENEYIIIVYFFFGNTVSMMIRTNYFQSGIIRFGPNVNELLLSIYTITQIWLLSCVVHQSLYSACLFLNPGPDCSSVVGKCY